MNNYNKRKMEKDASLTLAIGGTLLGVLLARRAVKNFIRDLPNRKLDNDIIVNDKLPADIIDNNNNMDTVKASSFNRYYSAYRYVPTCKQANFNSYYDLYADSLYKNASAVGVGRALYGLGKGLKTMAKPTDWLLSWVYPRDFAGKAGRVINNAVTGFGGAVANMPRTVGRIGHGYSSAAAIDKLRAAQRQFRRGKITPQEYEQAKAEFRASKASIQAKQQAREQRQESGWNPFTKQFWMGNGTYANGQPIQGQPMAGTPGQYYQQVYGGQPVAQPVQYGMPMVNTPVQYYQQLYGGAYPQQQ